MATGPGRYRGHEGLKTRIFSEQTGLVLVAPWRRRGNPEFLIGLRQRDPAARRAHQVSLHDQERLVNLLDRRRVFTGSHGQRIEPYRTAAELVDDHFEQALVHFVEPLRINLDHRQRRIRDRASAVIIRVRHIAEFTRRLRLSLLDARGVAFEATIEAWRVDEELAEVGDRVDACVRLVEAALDAHRSKQDARRNVLLYALAVLGVSQVVFAVYDFITADATIVGHSPRPVILAVTVVVIAGLMVFDVRRHRRSG